MVNITNPMLLWAVLTLVSVVLGTFLLIVVAFVRRWQQVRYARYLHALRREYRPLLAKLLRGEQRPSGIEALRELPISDRELLLDPLLSRRRLSERQLVFLQALCADLGLITLWQGRVANGNGAASGVRTAAPSVVAGDRALVRHVLRAKSIRNLGTLRHRPSWELLAHAVNDRHRDIQLVALRSLAAVGAVESFPILRERLREAVAGKRTAPPVAGLLAAMAGFDLRCAAALRPLLHHPDHALRLQAAEVLRTMVWREAHLRPQRILTEALLTPEVMELVLTRLAADLSAEIRARAADVIVFLADERVTSALHGLLIDRQWFVRLHTVRAISRLRQDSVPLHPAIRACLRDPHWRVREAAVQTFVALGGQGRRQLFEHFLTSSDPGFLEQMVEVIERTGFMSDLVEEYSSGAKGLDALVVERLASEAAPLGLAGILRTLDPDIRKKFLDRFLPSAEARTRHFELSRPTLGRPVNPQPRLPFPPSVAA